MTFRNSKRLAETSSQKQTKKSFFLYLVIILSIAFNSLAVLSLSEYLSATKVGNISQAIEQPEDNEANPLPTSNPPQKRYLLDKYFVYLLSAIVAGIPTCICLVLLAKKLVSSRENTTLESAIDVEDPDSQADVLVAEQKSNSATSDRTLGYDPNILLANLSHELRSPLNAILGFAQIMEQESDSNRSAKANIAIVNRSGERLLSIVNDVVDLAKIETEQFALEQNHIDFGNWLDNLEQNLNLANNNWQFSLVRQSDLPQYICLDERRLRQILINIIDYCLQQSSKIKIISLKVTASTPLKLLANGRPDSQNSDKYNLNFEVENANFETSDRELTTLFDPIVRAQQESKSILGSSLNLPISRRLAQLMGGDLSVTRSGLGIVFNLEIQAQNTVAQRSETQFSSQRVIGLESNQVEYRILIVDDSKTNRKIMLNLLEPVGFILREAVNGKEAVDIWWEWQPHMIWMDLRMPVMNGCEATELIKSYSQTSPTPIIALSATTLEEEKQQSKAAGCDDFVGKPFAENAIFDKIAQHLDIRYRYEPILPNNSTLPDNVAVMMSRQWWRQLESAASILDRDALTKLLQQIPPEHSELKQTLQQYSDSFDFDEILSFIARIAEIKP